ncbi:MAG: hypothetical protein JXX29_13265 [Deltaproteobacteria bacterium]|nr:hypothetical protein [Deltaproteobacteria bacterium]MBN2672648.1 hypothetical protein [Deltaproteobacteria bacterium]
MSSGESGNLFDRCSTAPEGDLLCDDGLICGEAIVNSSESQICFTPCTTDADCPAPGALYCAEDGLCRIANDITNCAD